jgi:DNA-binding GntR family transcriptional regulator
MTDAFLARSTATQLSVSESLREQALMIIRQGLVTGEIAVGEIYSAAAVASRLGVSSSPVREAMLTLVSEGLMEPVRNRGYRVVPLSDEDRRDIHQLRLMLEPRAMSMLANEAHSHTAALKGLQEIAEMTVSSARDGELLGHLESDRNFHLGLMQLVGNRHLTEFVMRLRDQTRRYSIKAMPPEQLVANAEEHYELLKAIIEGNPQSAEDVMVRHLHHLGIEPSPSVT